MKNSIENLNLSVRTYNTLQRHGITTVEELKDRFDSLKRFSGLGDKSIKEIQQCLDNPPPAVISKLNNAIKILQDIVAELKGGLTISDAIDLIREPDNRSVEEYINSFTDERLRIIIRMKLSGKNLIDIAVEVGCSKEAVRQKLLKIMREMRQIKFIENKYIPFFSRYVISCEEFMDIFNEPQITYDYLNTFSPKQANRRHFKLVVTDNTLPQEIREAIERSAVNEAG